MRFNCILTFSIILLLLPYNLQFLNLYENKLYIPQNHNTPSSGPYLESLDQNNTVSHSNESKVVHSSKAYSKSLAQNKVISSSTISSKGLIKAKNKEEISFYDEELTILQEESYNKSLSVEETLILGHQNVTNSINGTVNLFSLWNSTIFNGNAESPPNPWEFEGINEYAYCNRTTEKFSQGESSWKFNITNYPQLWTKWRIPISNQTITSYANLSFHFLLLNQSGLDTNGTTSQITLSLTFDTANITFFIWRNSPFTIGDPTDREDIRVNFKHLYYFINSTWDGIWHNLSVIDLTSLIKTYCNVTINKLYEIEVACGSFPSPFTSIFFIDELTCNVSIHPQNSEIGLYLDNEPIDFFNGETFPIILNFEIMSLGTTLLSIVTNQENSTIQGNIIIEITFNFPLFFESNFSLFDLENLEANIYFSTLVSPSSIKELILNVPTDWKQLYLYGINSVPLENTTESCYKANITNENTTTYILTAITHNYIHEIHSNTNSPQQGEYINISVSMYRPVQGPILLFMKNQEDIILLQTETICFVTGIALFSNLKVPFQASKGNISIEVYWFSSSEAGIGSLKLFIPTNVGEIQSPDWIEVYQLDKINLNGTVIDLHTNTSIENGNITVSFEELSQKIQFSNQFNFLIGPIFSNPGNKSLILSCEINGYIIPPKEIKIIIKQSGILVEQKLESLEEKLYKLSLNVTNSEHTPVAGLSVKINNNNTLINLGFTDEHGVAIIYIQLPQILLHSTFNLTIQIIWSTLILWENTTQILLPEVVQYNAAFLGEIIHPQYTICNETVIIHAKISYPSEGRFWYIFSPFQSNEIKTVQLLHKSEVINVRLEQEKLFWELPSSSSTDGDELIFQVRGPTVLIKRSKFNDTVWPRIDLNVTSMLMFDSIIVEISLTTLEKTITNWFAFDILGRNITQDIIITKKPLSILVIQVGSINANSSRLLTLTGIPAPLEVELDSLPETLNCNESLYIQINVTSLVSIPFGIVEFNINDKGSENISLSVINSTDHKYVLITKLGPFLYNTTARYRILVWDVFGWIFQSSYFFLSVTDSINPKAVLNIKTQENNEYTIHVSCWEEHPFESGIDEVLILIFSNNKNRTEVLTPLNNSNQEWITEIVVNEESRIKLLISDKAGNQISLPQDNEYLILKPQNTLDMDFQDVIFLSAFVALATKGTFWILSFIKKKETIKLD